MSEGRGKPPPDSAALGKFKQQTKHQPTKAASDDESEATNQPIHVHVTAIESPIFDSAGLRGLYK